MLALLNVVDTLALVAGFLLIAVGTFLLHDGRPGHQRLGWLEEKLGAGAMGVTMLLNAETTQASRSVCKPWEPNYNACMVEHTDWTLALGVDDLVKGLVVAAVAWALGRGVAWLTPDVADPAAEEGRRSVRRP